MSLLHPWDDILLSSGVSSPLRMVFKKARKSWMAAPAAGVLQAKLVG
mgnify:CR=1 FL=1